MHSQYANVLAEFSIDVPHAAMSRISNGHIHETFRISPPATDHAGYLLQKMNRQVFHDIPQLMANLTRITGHLRKALSELDCKKRRLLFPEYRSTREGLPYYRDEEGNCWRVCQFIPHAPKASRRTAAIEGAGRAFGAFLFYLRDLPIEQVCETLPNFHALSPRLETFQRAVQGDPAGRLRTCRSEVEEVYRGEWARFQQFVGQSGIPWRVTHNDTKIDNVLFDQTGSAIAVIDLDTVMPGLVHYDFGDAIRTCANRGAEDAQDLATVEFDLARFEAFARGYLGETIDLLVEEEKSTLIDAPQLLTYLMAIRFLTDYLLGDIYYHTAFPLHNLVRTRVQLKLLNQMQSKRSQMELILRSLLKRTPGSMA